MALIWIKKHKYGLLTGLMGVLIVCTILRIWSFSWQSSGESSQVSSSVSEVVQPIVDPEGNIPPATFHGFIRKSAHFLEFALLGFETMLFAYLLSRRRISPWLLLPLFVVLLCATLDEFIQSFHDRGSAVKDVLLDFSGGVTGIALMLLCLTVGISFSGFLRKKKAGKATL